MIISCFCDLREEYVMEISPKYFCNWEITDELVYLYKFELNYASDV